MKLIINQVVQNNQPYNGTSKAGKPYTLYSWVVNGLIDNNQVAGITVKTMSKKIADSMEIGKPYDVDQQNYNGNISYFIAAPKSDYKPGGYSKPAQKKGSLDQYMVLVEKIDAKVKSLLHDGGDLTAYNELFRTLLNNSGFWVDIDSVSRETNTQNYKDAFQGQEMNDEEIPF